MLSLGYFLAAAAVISEEYLPAVGGEGKLLQSVQAGVRVKTVLAPGGEGEGGQCRHLLAGQDEQDRPVVLPARLAEIVSRDGPETPQLP